MGRRAEPAAATPEGRDRLHRLVDELPDEKLETARLYLELANAADEPAFAAMLRAATREPEELSEKDLKALEEAREDVEAGRLSPHDEVWKRLLPDE